MQLVNRLVVSLLISLLLFQAPLVAVAQTKTSTTTPTTTPTTPEDKGWPREMNTSKGILTIYQPQPEKFEGDLLQARAAVSLLQAGKTNPVFGVVWFQANVDTDNDKDRALLRNLKFMNARWPESTEAKQAEFTAFMNGLIPKTDIPISLSRLRASLATVEQERKSIEGLKHDPPKFVITDQISQLVLYDGEPRSLRPSPRLRPRLPPRPKTRAGRGR